MLLLKNDVRKTFHNLLLLLNTFEIVRRRFLRNNLTLKLIKVYLLSALSLFSLPLFRPNFTIQKLNMLYVLAVAHVAMVRLDPTINSNTFNQNSFTI